MVPPQEAGLRECLREDFRGFIDLDDEKTRSAPRRTLDVLTLPGFWAVVLYRLAARAHANGLTPVARVIFFINIVLFSAEISPRLTAGPGLVMPHPQGCTLGAGVTFGRNVKVYRNVGIGTAGFLDKTKDGFPMIGDGCTIFDSARIFGPVTVGDGSVIGTNVTLLESIPPNSFVRADTKIIVRTAQPTSD